MQTTDWTPAPQWLLDMVRSSKRHNDPGVHARTCGVLAEYGLNTVCESARCPNRGRCFSGGTATFMILGNICTRNCTFCAVEHGKPLSVAPEEPLRLKEAVRNMGLNYVVVTSVTRDDLSDGGAGHFAAVIEELHSLPRPPVVEVLIPDFRGSVAALDTVLKAGPEVIAHNMETVPRLYPQVRAGASYQRSLDLLGYVAAKAVPGMLTKTGFMLGLGEEEQEVTVMLKDLRDVGVNLLTIGQYLAPSLTHYPVQRYVAPREFAQWAEAARKIGFKGVASGPLVRSSYRAGDYYREVLENGTSLAAD